MSSQSEPRRRSLRIIESRRKILRDAIREIVQEYKRAARRQRWRDAIWDIIQQKRAKKDRLKRMVRKMAEQRRAQKAAELRAGGAWCVCLTMPPVNYTCSVCFGSMPSIRNSSSPGRFSIPQSECGAVRRAFIWPAYCKVCTRNMAAPTNIFGGASIVDVISWIVRRRTFSILELMTWIHLTRMTMRK